MSELLPCPFCGDRSPVVYELRHGDKLLQGFMVECSNCSANVDRMDSEEEAVEAWNRRAPLQQETDKDGERWQRFCELWAASTELRVTQDEDGTWSIFQVEAVENEGFCKLTGNTPDDAIDAAIAALPQKDSKI